MGDAKSNKCFCHLGGVLCIYGYDGRVDSAASDVLLAGDLIRGAPGAFDRFVNLYRDKVFRYSFSMCGQREDAEEVAQETLLKVLENLGQLREPGRLKPWVFQIAKNACFMKRRKSVFAPAAELSLDDLKPQRSEDGAGTRLEIADWSALPEDLAASAEFRRSLDRAVAALPDLYRAVFLLRDIEELSTSETAEVLGINEDAVKTRLHRARLALRQRLDAAVRSLP